MKYDEDILYRRYGGDDENWCIDEMTTSYSSHEAHHQSLSNISPPIMILSDNNDDYDHQYRRRCHSLPNCQMKFFDNNEQQSYNSTSTECNLLVNVDESFSTRIVMPSLMLLIQFGISSLYQRKQQQQQQLDNNGQDINIYLSLSNVVLTIVLYAVSSYLFYRSMKNRTMTTTTTLIPIIHHHHRIDDTVLLMIPDTVMNIVLVLIVLQQSVLAYRLLLLVSGIMLFLSLTLSFHSWLRPRKDDYGIRDITLRHALLGFEYFYYYKR